MRKNRRTDEKLSLRLGTLQATQGFTQSLTRSLTSLVTRTVDFDPLSLNPILAFEAEKSMLAAGGGDADNLDLVATLENRVSGGANATQTTASKQPIAHVPLGDGHLYLSGVSGNGAQITSDSTANITGDIDIRGKLTLPDANWIPPNNSIVVSRDQVSGSNRTYTFFIRHTSGWLDFTYYNASGGLVGNINSGARPQFSAGDTGWVRVTRESSSGDVKYWKSDDGTSWTQVGSTKSTPAGGMRDQSSLNLTMGFRVDGNALRGAFHEAQIYSSIDETSKVLDIDFSDGDHKASSFTCSTGQTVTINTSGNDPATIVRKSFMRMDLVDDEYEFTTGSAVNGTIVVATLEGTYSANISLDASTQYDLQARGVASTPNHGFLKNPVGYLVSSSPLSESEITKVENYFVDKGAAARSAFGSVTNFTLAWYKCNSLTSFPLINTSSVTSFFAAWYKCSSLTSFPLLDTSSGTSFDATWRDCTSLTSFPSINTSSGTIIRDAWRACSSLTSFPPLDTSSGTSFDSTWRDCTSLTSFPLIDTSSGTNFFRTWYNCSSLTSFPLIDTSSGTSFSNAWNGCSSLTSFPLIDASSVASFSQAWQNCTSLTSFPLINASSGTNFFNTWNGCSSLTSFPMIDASSGTQFSAAWYNCSSLTSFPVINVVSGTNFGYAWYNGINLTTFPSGFFDSWSPASVSSGVFNAAWDGCTSLTAQSVENILTSIDTSGVYGTNTGASGGTQLADNTIDIDYDGTTLSSATSTAITNLKSKNWAISINSVIQ